MYLEVKAGEQRSFLAKAIKKAGTIRKLSMKIDIPRTTIFNLYSESRRINEDKLSKIENYLNKKFNRKKVIKMLPDNWKQIIGGRNCAKEKTKNGTLYRQLKAAREKITLFGKASQVWHNKMKRENPKEYYTAQYERFKKIGGYKFTTNNGEKVRNKLELETANRLKELGIVYQYEPCIQVDNRCFFPDFVVNDKIIIECTMWRGYDKAVKLREKIKHLKKRYKVYVLIPKALNKYYKMLNNHLIFELNDKDSIA